MDIYQILEGLTAFSVLLALFVLLFLQVSMFRRFGHISFLLLSGGSVFGIVYFVLYSVPFFFQVSDAQRLLIFQCESVAAVVAAILGVSGTVGLFRSYRGIIQAIHEAPRGA